MMAIVITVICRLRKQSIGSANTAVKNAKGESGMDVKIYVIIETDFNDLEVLAATTNAGKAESLRRHFELERGDRRGAVEVYEFNEHEFDGLIFHGHHHYTVFMRFDGSIGDIRDWGNTRMVVPSGLSECIPGMENGCIYRFDCYAENPEKAQAQSIVGFKKYLNERYGV